MRIEAKQVAIEEACADVSRRSEDASEQQRRLTRSHTLGTTPFDTTPFDGCKFAVYLVGSGKGATLRRFDHLVVMNSLAIWDERTSWEIDLLREFGWNRLLLEHLPRAVYRRALRTFLPRGCKLPRELHEDLWLSFKNPAVRQFVVRMCAGYQGTLRKLAEAYPKIKTHSFFLWAGQDKHFPIAHAHRLAALVPHSRLREMPSAEHWMALYLASEVNARILNFLGAP